MAIVVERIHVDLITKQSNEPMAALTPLEFSTGKRTRACIPSLDEDSKADDSSKIIDISCSGGCEGLFARLRELLASKELCDVIIVVGVTEFAAHRLVLAASSNFFRCAS